MKKIKVISCIATFTIMAMIFFFSSQNSGQSSELSMGVSRQITEILTGFLSKIDVLENITAEEIHGLIRKTAHFTIYAGLGVSSAWMFNVHTGKKRLKLILITAVFCFLYAITDEVHQMFVDGRSSQITDVILDTFGSIFGGFIYLLLKNIYDKSDYKFDGWITLTVIVMFVIFLFSSQNSDSSNELSKGVSHLFKGVYNYLSSKDETLTFMKFNYYVRKAAHFTMFFVLGGVTAVMLSKKSRLNIANIWIVSVLLSAVYALCDEWHQSFVDGRGPLLSDVGIDVSGAIIGIAIYIIYLLIRKKKPDLNKKVRRC